jgi:dsDNA-specific endonuclease/ATPase MutS2
MIEMTETAKILNYATPKSLIIIDELGRGTSTSDGQSIAMATLEKLNQMKVKTLFSTHYHQLTEINLPRVKNYHLDIIENEDGSINFVRKLKLGSTDKSYGIHVARLAGIPDDVIIRAFELLEQIEEKDPFRTTVRENGNGSTSNKYYDKLINGKKNELEKLNLELTSIKQKTDTLDEALSSAEKELEKKKIEIRDIQMKIQTARAKTSQSKSSIRKKYVQTSLFEPKAIKGKEEEVEMFLKSLDKLDINTLSHQDLKDEVLELKKKIRQSSNPKQPE